MLNNLFDTSKPIVEQLASYGSFLPDHIFNQALNEYGLPPTEEDRIMDEMYDSEKYDFVRVDMGWEVSLKD